MPKTKDFGIEVKYGLTSREGEITIKHSKTRETDSW